METNVAEDFAELVYQASDGRIEITVHGGGELMPIGETYEAIGAGTIGPLTIDFPAFERVAKHATPLLAKTGISTQSSEL